MDYEVSPEDIRKAKHPHELFLFNLIFNHILLFVAFLSGGKAYLAPLALVPLISLGILAYTLWRARRSLMTDSWYVKCHWQVSARRSRAFIVMLGLLVAVSLLGWAGHAFLGMMDVAVMALIGGMGIFPTLVTVLILIVMESDALHQAHHGRLPAWVVERFPRPGAEAAGP